MSNPINISGKSAEDRLKNFLINKNIPYKHGLNKTIDFTVYTKKKVVYIDCTNQNVEGSVQEKVPHKIWKYHKRIGFNEVIIQRGNLQLHKEVMAHIKDLEITKNIKVFVLTEDEVKNYLLELPKKENRFFNDIPHSEHRRMESEGVYEEKFGEPNSSSDSDAPKYFNDEWNGKKPKDIQDWEETPFGKSHKKFTTNVGDYDDIENSEYDAISLPKKDDDYIDDDYDY